MKGKIFLCALAMLMLSSLGCGLANGLLAKTGGAGTVSDLWPDVPRMGGLTKTDLQLPLAANLLIQTYVKTAASQNQGTLNYIGFVATGTPADVTAFYTADRMQSAGWNGKSAPGCVNDTSTATPAGGLCIFTKENSAGVGALLAVVTDVDATTKQTQVFFARIDMKNLPTPTVGPG
jgi:hypothetical protein